MKKININISKRVFNSAFFDYLHNDSRYLVFYGGAGSGKSFFIAQRYIYLMLTRPMLNLMVVRAVGNTNRDSTFALLKQVINKWGLTQHFKYNESELRITCLLNKNSIIFKGLDDTEKLKSVTFEKGELTDIWIEEASETDEESFNQLDMRLRGGTSNKQIVISFNPVNVNHWLKKRFFDAPNDKVTTLHTTYKDNDFLDDEYRHTLESYKDIDPYYYQVYCLGMWGVYGKTVFDAAKINSRLADLKLPLKVGYFLYSDGMTDIRWVDDPNGYIRIYKEPKEGYPYVIGGDTAGEGSDSFTGQVLDNTTGEQVATLKSQFDEDLYSCQMYCLGMHYNTALIGLEVNFSTYPIKTLERLHYPRQYVREREDTYTGKLQQSYGYRTQSNNRPAIIAELVTLVRENVELINDAGTLDEMLTFVRNEKGRPEAQNGAHDDLIMGLAIAHAIRGQQSYTPTIEKQSPKIRWTEDMWEDWQNANEEMRKLLIMKWGEPN